jgi:hypothetical protein
VKKQWPPPQKKTITKLGPKVLPLCFFREGEKAIAAKKTFHPHEFELLKKNTNDMSRAKDSSPSAEEEIKGGENTVPQWRYRDRGQRCVP